MNDQTQPLKQQHDFTNAHPLSTLVMAELIGIRKKETELQTRFVALSTSLDGAEAEIFQTELGDLHCRADRVSRMLNEITWQV
jgi:hypothetical protein